MSDDRSISGIAIEIVTPEGMALADSVEEFTAPAEDGEVGVLPGHRPFMTAVRTGILAYRKGSEWTRVAVAAGFLEVSDNSARLLTDRFAAKSSVDPVRVRLDLKDADEALDRFDGEPGSAEHARLVAAELWAATQLELYGDPPPPVLRTWTELELRDTEDFARTAVRRAADDDGDA